MVDTLWPANVIEGAPLYDGRMLRQVGGVALSGATATRPLGARTGVRPGTSATTVTATASTWTCGPFAGVADVMTAAEAGAYEFAFDANATGVMAQAHATLSRKDIVYVAVTDPAESVGTAVGVTRKYLAGTAAATPVAPAVPASERGFVVAEINVPASGGGAPTVTWVAPAAVSAGGIVPVSASAYPAAPHRGQYVDDAILGLLRWSGARWVAVNSGLNLVRPSAVTGATLSGAGLVTFSSVQAASLDGVFSTLFDNYLIQIDVTGSSGAGSNLFLRMRTGGTSDTAANYFYELFYGNEGSAAAAEGSAQTSFQLTAAGGPYHAMRLELHKPAVSTVRTSGFPDDSSGDGVTFGSSRGSLWHGVPTTHDGFELRTAGGVTISGTIRVYGYYNG